MGRTVILNKMVLPAETVTVTKDLISEKTGIQKNQLREYILESPTEFIAGHYQLVYDIDLQKPIFRQIKYSEMEKKPTRRYYIYASNDYQKRITVTADNRYNIFYSIYSIHSENIPKKQERISREEVTKILTENEAFLISYSEHVKE